MGNLAKFTRALQGSMPFIDPKPDRYGHLSLQQFLYHIKYQKQQKRQVENFEKAKIS